MFKEVQAQTQGGIAETGSTNSAATTSQHPAEVQGPATTRTKVPNGTNPMLRYVKPYWWPYKTFVKERWIGRELLEVVSTEFRDRSIEYYRHALESGVTKVNGVPAYPTLVLRNGDRIDNTVHRHEPPVANMPILLLHKDEQREFIVISKPGSMPVHATGRYFRNTILEVLKSDFGINAFAVNRLDRLTSGLMIMALTSKASRELADEFFEGKVKKEYVARVRGRFPEGEILVDQPLLTVDRQMGLVIVTPEGKEARTTFEIMSYDEKRNQSVVRCRPQTGRTHQLRVHLQYLGFPIANDPLYAPENVWGERMGRGGVALPTEEEIAKAAAGPVDGEDVEAGSREAGNEPLPSAESSIKKRKLLPREDDSSTTATSPILLSEEARQIICKLRKMKDEAEDWVRWKEVVFTAQKAQQALDQEEMEANGGSAPVKETPKVPKVPKLASIHTRDAPEALPEDTPSLLTKIDNLPEGFCPDCFIPLPDDPDPETLFIYLHARAYTTERWGKWETPLPRWASPNWDGEWRGWADE